MSEYTLTNEASFNLMLKDAERRGQNVVFVLEPDHRPLGGVNVYKLPVPGELDRKAHFVCWFMYLPQYHGAPHGQEEETHQKAHAEAQDQTSGAAIVD
jgi:hypothetical protein